MGLSESVKPERNNGSFGGRLVKAGATLVLMAAAGEGCNLGFNLIAEQELQIRAKQAIRRMEDQGLTGRIGSDVNKSIETCLDTHAKCNESARDVGVILNPYAHAKCAYQEWGCITKIENGANPKKPNVENSPTIIAISSRKEIMDTCKK